MKPRPLNRSIATLFFAPDNDNTGGAVPATESPTGSAIPAVEPPSSGATVMEPPQREPSKVLSAREALGLPESPRKEVAAMTKDLRTRTQAGAIKLPPKKSSTTAATPAQPKPGSSEQAQPPAKPVETVVGEQTEPAKTPTLAPPEQKTPEVKIPYKGKEYTAAEFAAMMEKAEKDLAERTKTDEPPKDDKTKPAGKTDPKKDAAKDAPKGEPTEADKMKAFIDRRAGEIDLEAAGITVTEDGLDTILAGGKEGVAAFADLLKRISAVAEAHARQDAERRASSIRNDVKPALELYQKIQEAQSEQTLLGMAPDIAQHAEGRETMRQVADRIHAEYDRCQRLISAGVASEAEQQWAQEYETSTPEEFSNAILENTRKALGVTATTAQAQTPPAAEQTPPPAKKTPPPPTGHVGGTPAPQAQNIQKAMAQDLLDHT